MPITKAIGLGVALVLLKILTPAVFSQAESTIITMLRAGQQGAAALTATDAQPQANDFFKPRFALPQAPGIVRSH